MGPRDDAAKKVQSILCLETVPKFWTEDVAVVWRDGEWLQMGMRGMAVFFCAMLLRTGLDSSAFVPEKKVAIAKKYKYRAGKYCIDW